MFRGLLLSPLVSFYDFSSHLVPSVVILGSISTLAFCCIALFGTVITAKWPVGTSKTKFSESFNYCKNHLYGEGHRRYRVILHSARPYPSSLVIRHAGNSEGKCRSRFQFIQASRTHLEARAPSTVGWCSTSAFSQFLTCNLYVRVSRITNSLNCRPPYWHDPPPYPTGTYRSTHDRLVSSVSLTAGLRLT